MWQDQDKEWHFTKRLYGLDTVEDLGEYHCEFKEIASDFIDKVTEWLDDEIAYLRDMYDDLAEEDVPMRNRIFKEKNMTVEEVKERIDHEEKWLTDMLTKDNLYAVDIEVTMLTIKSYIEQLEEGKK